MDRMVRSLHAVSSALSVTFACAVATATVAVASSPVMARDGHAAVSKRAPKFLLETPGGSTLTLRDLAGKPLVLNVFASWCPPCRQELPLLAAAARRVAPRITFIGVDEQEATEIATTFAKQMHLPYAIAIDHGQFAASYDTVSLPETIFIDERGIVRAIVHGPIDAPTLARDLALIAPRRFRASPGNT